MIWPDNASMSWSNATGQLVGLALSESSCSSNSSLGESRTFHSRAQSDDRSCMDG